MRFSTNSALLAAGLALFSSPLSSASPVNVDLQSRATSWETYQSHSVSTAGLLISKYYDEKNGEFADVWWNSAVTWSELIDLSAMLGSTTIDGHAILPLLETTYDRHTGAKDTQFKDTFTDDEGWWALTWISAWDLTKEAKYLTIAESLYTDMWSYKACDNAIWWNKKKTVATTVENVLMFAVAAHLATRTTGSKSADYKSVAEKSWATIQSSGIWDPKSFFVGGNIKVSTCKVDSSNSPAPYTQGVLIGAFLEYAKLTKDDSYNTLAKNTATATINTFTKGNDGVFSESRSSGYTNDLAQFKGVFFRYLMILHRSFPEASYLSAVQKSADSIWSKARNSDGTIIVLWQGNPSKKNLGSYSLEVSTSSANQAIIAAYSMTKGIKNAIT